MLRNTAITYYALCCRGYHIRTIAPMHRLYPRLTSKRLNAQPNNGSIIAATRVNETHAAATKAGHDNPVAFTAR
jgi:TRAP-type C4-dicarboxylate transport system substrate-binding protein